MFLKVFFVYSGSIFFIQNPPLMKSALLAIIIAGLTCINSFGQESGSLRGKVIDKETGESIIGATITIKQTNRAAISDLDGNFSILGVATGMIDVECTYLGYGTQRILGLQVKDDRVALAYFKLGQGDARELGVDVVVTAQAARNLEGILLKQRKNNTGFLETLSSEEIFRTGAESVADAMKMIPNVTIEEDNSVVIRGLGNRYSKVFLNGAEIPDLNINNSSVDLELFPAAAIDNIIIHKTFSPELSGNLGGGHAEINLKTFPDRFNLETSYSVGYNTLGSFKQDFLTYKGGKQDWIGLDKPVRAIPDVANPKNPLESPITKNPDLPTSSQNLSTTNEHTMAFNNDWNILKQRSNFNSLFNFTVSDQSTLGEKGKALSYGLSLLVRNAYEHYNDGETGRYRLLGDYNTATSLVPDIQMTDQLSKSLFRLNILGTIAYKSKKDKIILTLFNNRKNYKITRLQEGTFAANDPSMQYRTQSLLYGIEGIMGPQLEGKHLIGRAKNELKWMVAGRRSYNNQPDWRYFSEGFTIDSVTGLEQNRKVSGQLGQAPSRYYRSLTSGNVDVKVDLTLKSKSPIIDKIKTGIRWKGDNRAFCEYQYRYQTENIAYDGNAETFLSAANYPNWDSNTEQPTNGIFIYNAYDSSHNYTGLESVAAAYAMVDLKLIDKLKLSVGVRAEHTLNFFTDDYYKDSIRNKYISVFPALLASYNIHKDGMLRLAYSSTVARPSMRELSKYTSFDYIGDFETIGNPYLKQTTLHNLDFRWEWYPRIKELISVGAFFKYLKNPISRVALQGSNHQMMQYRNLDHGFLAGAELEVRKQLDFLGTWAKDLRLICNAAYIHSQVTRDSANYALAKLQNSQASRYRRFYKDPTFVANMSVDYNNEELGFNANINLNMVGQKLVYATEGATPDIFEKPRFMLNFLVAKTFFKQLKVQFVAENILGAKMQQVYKFKEQEYKYRSYGFGRTFWLSISYNLK